MNVILISIQLFFLVCSIIVIITTLILFRKKNLFLNIDSKLKFAKRSLWLLLITAIIFLALYASATYEYYFISRWAVFAVLGTLFCGLIPWLGIIVISLRVRKFFTGKFLLPLNIPFLLVITVEITLSLVYSNGLPSIPYQY